MKPINERIVEYWQWIGGALFLLITVDMLTTMYAAHIHGAQAESNPIIEYALSHGVVEMVLLNIAAVVLIVTLFYGFLRLIEESEPFYQRVLSLFLEVCLGLFVAVGLGVFANNISVIILGKSLI